MCLGSTFFVILTLGLMEEADAAAKIARDARTGNGADIIAACQAFCAMYCDDMTCIAKDADSALKYFITVESTMQARARAGPRKTSTLRPDERTCRGVTRTKAGEIHTSLQSQALKA